MGSIFSLGVHPDLLLASFWNGFLECSNQLVVRIWLEVDRFFYLSLSAYCSPEKGTFHYLLQLLLFDLGILVLATDFLDCLLVTTPF